MFNDNENDSEIDNEREDTMTSKYNSSMCEERENEEIDIMHDKFNLHCQNHTNIDS